MKAFFLRLSKILLRLALDEGLKRGLPLIYSRLDAEIPILLYNNVPPSKVEGVVASAISDALGQRPTTPQIQAVLSLYDPVKAALSRRR